MSSQSLKHSCEFLQIWPMVGLVFWCFCPGLSQNRTFWTFSLKRSFVDFHQSSTFHSCIDAQSTWPRKAPNCVSKRLRPSSMHCGIRNTPHSSIWAIASLCTMSWASLGTQILWISLNQNFSVENSGCFFSQSEALGPDKAWRRLRWPTEPLAKVISGRYICKTSNIQPVPLA